MGATPTQQANMQQADTLIWEPEESGGDQSVLPIPFRDPNQIMKQPHKAHLEVEGRTICKSRHQEKWAAHSPGSTVPASLLQMQGPWSHTTSINEEDLYPAEHPFIHILKDSDDWDETPYATTTTGFPLYKGSYHTPNDTILVGFQ